MTEDYPGSGVVVKAGILITGSEVLGATIPDANGPWLSRQLADLGVELTAILIVADHADDLLSGLKHMQASGADLVITTGGLGPTADDLSAEVVARFSGRELRLDPQMEEKIAAILSRFAAAGRLTYRRQALDAANRKQALVPEGAFALDPVGTAPGLIVPPATGREGPVVLVLPGPPRELQPMWEVAVKHPALRTLFERASPILTDHLRMFGTPESDLALSLQEIGANGLDLDQLEITTCLRKGEVEIDLRYREEGQETARELIRELGSRHRNSLYSFDGTSVDRLVAGLLAGRRLALAESCSAGLLAARITDLPGASAYFAGGVVSYSDEAKREQLGVDPGLLERHGAVSAEVAKAMALGALERFRADVAVAITGIAGPGGGSEEKPVGLVHFEVRTVSGESRTAAPVIPGDRRDVRERSALVAMHLLRRLLGGEPA